MARAQIEKCRSSSHSTRFLIVCSSANVSLAGCCLGQGTLSSSEQSAARCFHRRNLDSFSPIAASANHRGMVFSLRVRVLTGFGPCRFQWGNLSSSRAPRTLTKTSRSAESERSMATRRSSRASRVRSSISDCSNAPDEITVRCPLLLQVATVERGNVTSLTAAGPAAATIFLKRWS